jgi:hypothetical protein
MNRATGRALRLFLLAGLVVGPPFALSPRPEADAAPVPKEKAREGSGVLVLDDCDEDFKGKASYADNLTALDASGKVTFSASGFNNCESIGSNHMVAVDPKRGWIWALENVGRRVRKFDRKGKELLAIKDVEGHAVAVDPETGNLWVLTSKGTIYGDKTVVYGRGGKVLDTHDVGGWDIVYDPKGKSFWVAGQKLTKLSAKSGKVAFSKTITTWCASCLSVHPATGKVWVAVREHPQVAGSKNQLLGFDNDGALRHTVELDDLSPFHVSVSSKTGAVWVTIFNKSVRRYSSAGKLEAEHKVEALTAAADLTSDDVWVVTATEVRRMGPKGKVLKRAKHRGKTSQAWVVGF